MTHDLQRALADSLKRRPPHPCTGCGHDATLHHNDGPCVVRHCPCHHHREDQTSAHRSA